MTEKRRVRRGLWQQLPLLIALIVLWMLLWGDVSWLNLATGIIVALLVTRVFFLPPVELPGRFNPFWFVVFLAQFLGELVAGSFQVAFQAFSRRGITSNSVIAVQLSTRSDFLLTITAIAVSLIPGSLVAEVDREQSILYLHVLNTRDAADVERARESVHLVEKQLTRALGSRDDIERRKA